MSIETPWGCAETLRILNRDPAIIYATTPSHGGLLLDAQATEALLKRWPGAVGCMIGAGLPGPRGASWWEEDGAWSLVCLAFPEAFEPDAHEHALVAIDVAIGWAEREARSPDRRIHYPHGTPPADVRAATLRAIRTDVERLSEAD